jgi:hypothetical protein
MSSSSGSCLVICFRTNSLVNLVHSIIDLFVLHRRHYPAPRLRRAIPRCCLGSARGVRDMKFACFKKVKVEPALHSPMTGSQ